MPETAKNILFIMFDQLRFDHLSCAGQAHLRTLGLGCRPIGKTHMVADTQGRRRLGLAPDIITKMRLQSTIGSIKWRLRCGAHVKEAVHGHPTQPQ